MSGPEELITRSDVSRAQSMFVVKGNPLIQSSTQSFSLLQYKVLLYLISKIKPTDNDKTQYVFNIKDFCRVCNLDTTKSRTYIHYVKEIIRDIMSYTIEIKLDDGSDYITHWIQKCRVHPDGNYRIQFDSSLSPFLFRMSEFYTQYRLDNVLPMRSKYGLRLYELLVSYHNMAREYTFPLDDLRQRLDAEKYKTFADFRVNVLEPALKDINEVSDLKVEYNTIKTGRKITSIRFTFDIVHQEEEVYRRIERQKRLGYGEKLR